MKQITLVLSLIVFIATSGFGQSQIIGTELPHDDYTELWSKFEHFDLFEIPTSTVHEIVSNELENDGILLEMGPYSWDMELHATSLHTNDATVSVYDNGEIRQGEVLRNITYSGSLKGNPFSRIEMTVTPNMILGIINDGKNSYFIEQVYNIVEGAPSNAYIVYNTNSVLPDPNISCGLDEVSNAYHEHFEDIDQPEAAAGIACYEAIVALATDAGMATRHGGASGAQSRAIGILVLVQLNYDDEFLHEIKLTIGAQFNAVGTNPSAWNFSSINALLSTFRGWGNGGGFGTSGYDVATLWTTTRYGGIIGLAYVDVICGGSRYNICVDYTSSTNGLRNLQAHELGHNFSLRHDASGSPHIMAPAVNGSNTWSSQSISQMNSVIPYPCMGACPGQAPPIPDFVASPQIGCKPMVVQFTDLSTGNPQQWLWTFPGGVPGTSTQQNPIITYTTPGRYDVELQVTNAGGSNTELKRFFIDVGDVPLANFDANVILNEVFFEDESIVYGTGQYLWDFGDGNFSTDQNPTHTYTLDGIYIVTLTITTPCGSNSIQRTVEIVTPPIAQFRSDTVEMCVGTFITFTNLSSYNSESYTWVFHGGQPKTSTDENPTVKYDTAGLWTVELIAKNSRYQDLEKKTAYIRVDTNSVADFTPDVDSSTLEVMFMNESPNARSFKWDFGDDETSTESDPTHTYEKDSIYTVRLITSNFCGEDTTEQTIQVGMLPSADFSADAPAGCLPHVVSFSDSSSANTISRVWTFEGGSPATSTEENPVVTYNAVGDYKVTLVAVNCLGNDTLVEEKYITIDEEPSSDFDFTRSGYDISFSSQSTGADTYNWDFGDGENSNDENPMHTYQGDGDYNVILIVSNGCGMDTVEKVVSLSNRPNANFAADFQEGCVPMTIQLENLSSTNSLDYEWIIPGGSPSSSTDENPTVTFNNPGLYRITLIANNAFGSDTVVKRDFIEVLDVPEADFTFGLNGFTINFDQDSKYGRTYAWDFGDGKTSTEEDPSHVYTDEGEYKVILIVSNICGDDTISKNVTVTPKPIVSFNGDQTEICYGDTVRFTDNSANDPTSWLWTFDGGDPATSTDQNPIVVYDTPGKYRVQLEATNQFGTNESVMDEYITVYGDPISLFDFKRQGIRANFKNDSEQYGTFLWEFGDGETSTDFEPSHLYKRPGTYTVILTVSNACGEDVYMSEVSVKHEGVTFPFPSPPPVPNPSNGLVTLEFNGQASLGLEVLISDLSGSIQTVYSGDFLSGSFKKQVDLTHLTEGSYMIFFKTDHEVRMSKLIIQK